MGRYIIFIFVGIFSFVANTYSQESYDYRYVKTGGRTSDESTTIYVTTNQHKAYDGRRWLDGEYHKITIISADYEFILQTFDEDGEKLIGEHVCSNNHKQIPDDYVEYTLISNQYLIKKIIIYKEYAEIIFHTHSVNSKITVLK